MNSYFWRAELVLIACCLLICSRVHAHDEEHHGHAHDVMEECAEECSECARECSSCAAHCAKLLAAGNKEHRKTLATCLDCADICNVAAVIVSRRGPFNELICKACADACAKCGKACEAFPKDKHMARCARACRECEKECRKMLKHGHGEHEHEHESHT
jgi:hypothetical protein